MSEGVCLWKCIILFGDEADVDSMALAMAFTLLHSKVRLHIG